MAKFMTAKQARIISMILGAILSSVLMAVRWNPDECNPILLYFVVCVLCSIVFYVSVFDGVGKEVDEFGEKVENSIKEAMHQLSYCDAKKVCLNKKYNHSKLLKKIEAFQKQGYECYAKLVKNNIHLVVKDKLDNEVDSEDITYLCFYEYFAVC